MKHSEILTSTKSIKNIALLINAKLLQKCFFGHVDKLHELQTGHKSFVLLFK